MAEVWTPPAFDDIATDELVTAAYLNQLGNSLRFLSRVAYAEQTSNVSITGTAEGTANQIVSAGAITYDNVPHRITFCCVRAVAPASQTLTITLFDGSTALGILAFLGSTSPAQQTPVMQSRILTPTAASHTYNVKAHVNGGTGSIECGAGGSATNFPSFIEIVRIPT